MMKQFDLEDRTLDFSKSVIRLINHLSKNQTNLTLGAQVVRSGTSVGANYREASAALGNKDFVMKIKICRKEAMETTYWLKLLMENNSNFKIDLEKLIDESEQLTRIFSSIALKRAGS